MKALEKMEILPPADAALAFLAQPPLLTTESGGDFDALFKALQHEIMPKGVIEDMYVADIAAIIWEILRLRRCKTAIINAAYFDALKGVLAEVSKVPPTATPYIPGSPGSTGFLIAGSTGSTGFFKRDVRREEVPSRPYTRDEQERANLPFDWFHDKTVKAEVARKLAKFGLDESIIDARAIRTTWEDIELLDEMLISLENRRDKCLRQIEAYRRGFAERVRASADRVIDAEHEDVSPLTAPANTNSAA